MFKEPTIRHSYRFPNFPSHEWYSCKVDDASSILSGQEFKVVQKQMIEMLCDYSTGWKEAGNNDDYHNDNDKHLICVLLE